MKSGMKFKVGDIIEFTDGEGDYSGVGNCDYSWARQIFKKGDICQVSVIRNNETKSIKTNRSMLWVNSDQFKLYEEPYETSNYEEWHEEI